MRKESPFRDLLWFVFGFLPVACCVAAEFAFQKFNFWIALVVVLGTYVALLGLARLGTALLRRRRCVHGIRYGKDGGCQSCIEESSEEVTAALDRLRTGWQRTIREATEFKPRELSPEEEVLVKEKGLNALNYIPQSTLQRQAEDLQNHADWMSLRNGVLSRPEADPERRNLESREAAERLQRGLRKRFDGAGYGMFLLLIAAFSFGIIEAQGWPVGIFCCLLMLAVLELGYRLASR
jgi:hypothetical protein